MARRARHADGVAGGRAPAKGKLAAGAKVATQTHCVVARGASALDKPAGRTGCASTT